RRSSADQPSQPFCCLITTMATVSLATQTRSVPVPMKIVCSSSWLASLTLVVGSGAAAQTGTYPAQPAGAPSTNPAATAATSGAVRSMAASRLTGSISLDGQLDEPA